MSARELLARRKLAIAIAGALLVSACNPPGAPPPGPQSGALPPRIIPLPAFLSLAGGAPFQLTKETRVTVVGANPEVGAIGETLAALLRRATDFPVPVSASSNGSGSGSVEIRLGEASLGEDGYRLTVSSDSVRLRAGTPAGLFHGVQTIRQLLPADIESDIGVERSWAMPTVTVVDPPRY